MRTISEQKVVEFIGWLSGDIPELHSVEGGRLLDSWNRFLKRVMPVEPWGTWQQRNALAKGIKAGDRWIQIKSGRFVVAQAPVDHYDRVHLLHENGNKTRKFRHYFGQEFTPESPPIGESNPP